MVAARRHGTVVSFDLNYRPSLWKASGGTEAAAETNRKLVEQVDVLLGNEEDFSAALGYSLEGVDESHTDLDVSAYEQPPPGSPRRLPQPRARRDVAARGAHRDRQRLERRVQHARGVLRRPEMRGLEIFDRVGGGDSFASGLVYGLLSGYDVGTSLAYGVAHGALAMTTPGDTSMATLDEVERVMRGGGARVVR